MIRPRNLYGFYKPPRKETGRFREDRKRLMRAEWAEFCTNQCPHPGRQCDRGPCKEFREKFGRVKG